MGRSLSRSRMLVAKILAGDRNVIRLVSRSVMRPFSGWGLGLLVLASGVSASAGTNGFFVPTFRGQPGSAFAGWESFTVSIGNPGNKGDFAGSTPSATLFQKAPGALILGSGNIYNGADKSLFEIRYASSEPIADVYLQVRTLGTELDYSSVRLFAWTDSLSAPRTELDRLAFGPPPPAPGSGSGVSSFWAWDLTGLDATAVAVTFNAADINLSLDSATLDVRVVPEPGALALGLLGLATLGVLQRRR